MQIYANIFKINEKCRLSSIQKLQQICTWGEDVYYSSRNLLFTCISRYRRVCQHSLSEWWSVFPWDWHLHLFMCPGLRRNHLWDRLVTKHTDTHTHTHTHSHTFMHAPPPPPHTHTHARTTHRYTHKQIHTHTHTHTHTCCVRTWGHFIFSA